MRKLMLVGLIAASPVAAQDGLTLACSFDVECKAPGGCGETTYEARLVVDAGLDGDGPDARLSSASGEVEMTLYANVFGDVSGNAATFAGDGAGAFHTIAREPDGAAVYTVTMEGGPMVTTYLGRCEVAE